MRVQVDEAWSHIESRRVYSHGGRQPFQFANCCDVTSYDSYVGYSGGVSAAIDDGAVENKNVKRPPTQPGPCGAGSSHEPDHEQCDEESDFHAVPSDTRRPFPTPGDVS